MHILVRAAGTVARIIVRLAWVQSIGLKSRTKPAVASALTNDRLRKAGYLFFTDYYQKVSV